MANSAVVGLLRVLLSANTAEFEAAMKRASNSATNWSRDMKNIGQQATAVGSVLSKAFTVPLVGVSVAASKLAIDFETSFAGVRKTVNATEGQFAEMAQGFRTLAKTIPVNVNEINRLGEAAGALGIPKQDILEFTKVMAELGVTTNLTSDQAAESIAKIQNIFGAAGQDTDRFASTLVALGNDGASTESQIVEMATRIAGAGHTIGLSEGQVLGFASALSSVGINAESGGTALSRVMIDMAKAVSEGGAKLNEFAKVAGMTGAQFATAFKTDAAGAIVTFVEGLGKVKNAGGDTFGVLDKLGEGNIRVRDALLRAAGAGDLMRRALELQGKAWTDNTALTNAANERFKTTAAQMKVLWNRIQDVGITLGNALKPSIGAAISQMDKLIPLLDSMAKAFAAMPTGVQATVIGIGAVVAAAGPALIVFGSMARAASDLIGIFGKKGIATRALAVDLDGLTATGGKLTTSLGYLTNAMALASAAVVGWQIGRLIADLTGLDQKIADVLTHQNALNAARAQTSKGGGTGAVDASLVQKERELADAIREGNKAKAASLQADIAAIQSDSTRLAILDTINKAISLGANKNISYAAAVAFVTAKDKERRAGIIAQTAAQQAGTRATETAAQKTDRLRQAQEEIAAADRLYRQELTGIESALRLQVQHMDETGKSAKELAAQYGISEQTVTRFAASLKAGAQSQDFLARATRELTDDQKRQVDAMEVANRSHEYEAKALGVSTAAITTYLKNLKEATAAKTAQARAFVEAEEAMAKAMTLRPLTDMPGVKVDDSDGKAFAKYQADQARALEEAQTRNHQRDMEGTRLMLDQLRVRHETEIRDLGDRTRENAAFWDARKEQIDAYYAYEARVAAKTPDTLGERMRRAGVETKAALVARARDLDEFYQYALTHEREFTDEQIAELKRLRDESARAAGLMGAAFMHSFDELGTVLTRTGGLFNNLFGEIVSGAGAAVSGINDIVHATSTLGAVASGIDLGIKLQPLLGLRHGKLGDWVGTNRDGRVLVDQLAAQHGGYEQLHKDLLTLGDIGEQTWIRLTQVVGKSNPAQAAEEIAKATKLLEDAAAHTPEALANAAGYKTIDQLKAIAAEAKKTYDYMVSSGKYSAETIAQAFEAWQNAAIAAGDESVVAAKKTSDAIKALDDEMKSLTDSIANEAPEAEMGDVEKETLRRIEELAAKRKKLEDELQATSEDTRRRAGDSSEAVDGVGESVDGVGDALDENQKKLKEWADYAIEQARRTAAAFSAIPMPGGGSAGSSGGGGSSSGISGPRSGQVLDENGNVVGTVDSRGEPVLGFANGSNGYVDFGAGTLAMLHGVEKVTPYGSDSASSGVVFGAGSIIIQGNVDSDARVEQIAMAIATKVRRGGAFRDRYQRAMVGA